MTPELTNLEAVVPGKPIAWARTTHTAGGKRLTPARYRQWKAGAAEAFATFGRFRQFPADAEVAVQIAIHPDGVRVQAVALDPDRKLRPTGVTGDLDNYGKAVLDALQLAGVLTNDAAVVDLRLFFSPHPRSTQ